MKQLLLAALGIVQCSYAAQSVLTSKHDTTTTSGKNAGSSTLRHRHVRKSLPQEAIDTVISSPGAASSSQIPIPAKSNPATSTQTNAHNQLIKTVEYRTSRYQAKKKKYKAASEYLAVLNTESQILLDPSSKSGSSNQPNKRLIEDTQKAVKARKIRLETAKASLQDATTALKIARDIPRNSQEYCNLLHAELLSAQEIASEYKRTAQTKPSDTIRPFDLLPLSHQSRNFIESLGLANTLQIWTRTFVNIITSEYNAAKKAFCPGGYLAEAQREYTQAAEALAELKTAKDRFTENIRLLTNINLIGQTREHAQVKERQIKTDFAQAEQAVEKKRLAREEAAQHFNSLPQSSNPVENQEPFQSIFDVFHIPGTHEYHEQHTIKLLGAIKLRLRVLNQISHQNSLRNERWLLTGDIDSQLTELKDYVSRVSKLVLHTERIIKTTKIDASKPPLFNSLFLRETNTLHNSLRHFLHPIFHGHGEPVPKGYCSQIFDAVIKSVRQISDMKLEEAFLTLKHTLDDTGSSKIALNSLVGCISMVAAVQFSAPVAACTYKVLDRATHLYPMHTPDKYRVGSSSEQTILDAKSGRCPTFSSPWNEEKECPDGIERCPLLGSQSKGILSALKQFTDKIKTSEQNKRLPYFVHDADVYRTLSILTAAIADVYETNIKSALAKEACDDKNLKNTRTIIETLASLPTDFYNIEAAMRANKDKIDKLLEGYPITEKRKFYAWMRSLIKNAHNPNFAYDPKNVGINLLLVGPTGVGKSHTSSELCRLLGLTVIPMTLQEVIQSTNQSAHRLLESGELSPFEQKLAALPEDASSLLVIIYVDEASKESGVSESTLKRELCQNKNLFLSSLQVHLPTKRFMMLSCNDAEFLKKDVALGSRFFIIEHAEWFTEQKIRRLLPMVVNYFENNTLLKSMMPSVNLEEITREYVLFDPTINMRVLIARLSCIEDYFTTQHELETGNDYLFPDEDRSGYKPTFNEFLAGIFDTKTSAEQSTKSKSSIKSKSSKKSKRSPVHISKPSCSTQVESDEERTQTYGDISSSDSPASYTTEDTSEPLSSSSANDSFNDYDTD